MGNGINRDYSSGFRFITFSDIKNEWNRLIHGKKTHYPKPLDDFAVQRTHIEKPVKKINLSISDRLKSALYKRGWYRASNTEEYKISRIKILDAKLEKKQTQIENLQNNIDSLIENLEKHFKDPIRKELNKLVMKQSKRIRSYDRSAGELRRLYSDIVHNQKGADLEIFLHKYSLPNSIRSRFLEAHVKNDGLIERNVKLKNLYLEKKSSDPNLYNYRLYEFRESFKPSLRELLKKDPADLKRNDLDELNKIEAQVYEAAAQLKQLLPNEGHLSEDFEDCVEWIDELHEAFKKYIQL